MIFGQNENLHWSPVVEEVLSTSNSPVTMEGMLTEPSSSINGHSSD